MTDHYDERFKDLAHERLMAHREVDPISGCWVYTGTWDPRYGNGIVKIDEQQYNASRLAIWLYRGGFDLRNPSVRILHSCHNTPACFNPKHLTIHKSGPMNPRFRCACRHDNPPSSPAT